MRPLMFLCTLLVLPFAAAADDFGEVWYDGKAELNGYTLTVSRYGEDRAGQAVMIFVTEPFSETERVKADRVSKETFNALKLNFVRDFQTGLYDYNTMVSVFCRDGSLELKKVSFSSAEWCGHVFEELLPYPSKIERTIHSYFQGESTRGVLPHPQDGVLEDHLFILLRSLRGAFLESGNSMKVPFLPGPYPSRFSHREPEWTTATIARESGTESITVPAGTFVVHRYTVDIQPDRRGTFWIEDAYPHRIVRWNLLPDVLGELTGSVRLPYWELNRNGHENYLEDLGLR